MGRHVPIWMMALAFALLSSPSSGQDSIEGDLPAGASFDGMSDHASMFDLYQMARIALDVRGRQAEVDTAGLAAALEDALAANGYGGSRIVVGPITAGMCSGDGVIETRVDPEVGGEELSLAVASAVWISQLTVGHAGVADDMEFAQACQAAPN